MSKVFINPGHDVQYDSGAVNPYTGLREADVVLAVGELLKGYLEAAGCEVMLLQSDNLCGETPGLPCVCDSANEWGADVFVSLHCNAANGNAVGTEVLVYDMVDSDTTLANDVHNQIIMSLGTICRGIKERKDLAVLKHTNMPAILVEMAFIDQNDDARLLTLRQDDFARAIARGITDAGY